MNEILVAASHGPGRPAVLGAGSQFFVVWTDVNAQNLNGARFGVSGDKFNEFQINTTRGITGVPSIAPVMGGGFVASWITAPPAKLVFQLIDEGGRKQGSEVVVSTNVMTDADRFRVPAIAFLNGGNFVISWVSAMPTAGAQVRAAMYRSDGTKIGNEIAVSSSAGIHFLPEVAAFGGTGNDDISFVVAWTGGENGIVRSRFQLFNFDGTKAGGEVVPRESIGQIAAASFSSFPDPREFVSALGGADGTEEAVLTARLYTRTGDSLLTNITHRGSNTISFDPHVADLGTKALVTWTQRPVPSTGQFGTRVMAALIDVKRGPPDDVVVSREATPIATSNGGGQNSAAAAPVSDDSGEKIVCVWADGKPDGSQSVIKARVLSLVLN